MAGRKPPVVWSTKAEADLTDIWNYCVEAAGCKIADSIVRAIGDVCRMIEELCSLAARETKSGRDFAQR